MPRYHLACRSRDSGDDRSLSAVTGLPARFYWAPERCSSEDSPVMAGSVSVRRFYADGAAFRSASRPGNGEPRWVHG